MKQLVTGSLRSKESTAPRSAEVNCRTYPTRDLPSPAKVVTLQNLNRFHYRLAGFAFHLLG